MSACADNRWDVFTLIDSWLSAGHIGFGRTEVICKPAASPKKPQRLSAQADIGAEGRTAPTSVERNRVEQKTE